MRFMMMMIPKMVYPGPEAGPPDAEAMESMGRYNDQLRKAGVLLAVDGLHAPAKGVRATFRGGKATVMDGPFSEAKEVVGGYWMIQVASKEEAVEWVKRCPAMDGDVIELRQVFEMSDFPSENQKSAGPGR